jgi:hypothetical protein
MQGLNEVKMKHKIVALSAWPPGVSILSVCVSTLLAFAMRSKPLLHCYSSSSSSSHTWR